MQKRSRLAKNMSVAVSDGTDRELSTTEKLQKIMVGRLEAFHLKLEGRRVLGGLLLQCLDFPQSTGSRGCYIFRLDNPVSITQLSRVVSRPEEEPPYPSKTYIPYLPELVYAWGLMPGALELGSSGCVLREMPADL